jgi:hypothetical protein
MDSTRPHQSFFTSLQSSTLSGVAAFSSKKELAFLHKYSSAGFIAGVFFG